MSSTSMNASNPSLVGNAITPWDGIRVAFAEVLHEPSGTQYGMGDIAPASQVTLNGSRSRVWRELACAIFAQVRDVPHSRSFREVEERGNRRSEVHPHERREHIQALNPLNGSRMGSRVVPDELGVGAFWCRSPYIEAEFDWNVATTHPAAVEGVER